MMELSFLSSMSSVHFVTDSAVDRKGSDVHTTKSEVSESGKENTSQNKMSLTSSRLSSLGKTRSVQGRLKRLAALYSETDSDSLSGKTLYGFLIAIIDIWIEYSPLVKNFANH